MLLVVIRLRLRFADIPTNSTIFSATSLMLANHPVRWSQLHQSAQCGKNTSAYSPPLTSKIAHGLLQRNSVVLLARLTTQQWRKH